MNNARLLLLILLSLFFNETSDGNTFSPDSTPRFKIDSRGYIKYIPSVYFQNSTDSLLSEGYIHQRSSLRIENKRGLSFRADLRNRLYYGEVIRLQPEFAQSLDDDTGMIRLSKLWVDQPGFVLYSTFDRMFFQFDREKFKISIGRQRINWGINTIWNPNDLFNAWNYLDFDYEERPGSDAVRYCYFPDGSNSFDLVWNPASTPGNHIAALAWKFNQHQYDFQIIGGKYKESLVAGGGFAGHIQQTGFKGEASYFHPYKKNYGSEKSCWSIALNAERSFKDNWFLSSAVLYNSVSQKGDIVFFGSQRNKADVRQLMPWQWNFYANVVHQISPPVNLAMGFTWSPEDNSSIFLPSITWSVSDNFDFDMIAQSYFNDAEQPYHAVINSVYLRMRISY